MAIIPAFLAVFLTLVSPLAMIRLGQLAHQSLLRLLGENWIPKTIAAPIQFVFGLQIFLVSIFILKLVGAPWILALGLPLAVSVYKPRDFFQVLTSLSPRPSINFLLWFAVALTIGVSLFQVSHTEITTPWRNNYGDLAFHLGMITSFTVGDNFPPQYHIFPGKQLSYPFLINLWSSAFWALDSDLSVLPFIFLMQWVSLWVCLYYLLRGDSQWLLPWALLLGGGSYLALGHNSGELIGKNIPWASFLTTVWVPQRGAMLGITCLLAALSLLLDLRSSQLRQNAFFAGLILALTPLAHTHFFLVGVMFAGMLLLIPALWEMWAPSGITRREAWVPVIALALGLLPSLASLPWILGKSGIISFISGWSTGDGAPKTILVSAQMWGTQATFFIVAMVAALLIKQIRSKAIVVALLFIFGNFVLLAQWDWDQLKFFIGIYAALLITFSTLEGTPQLVIQCLASLLIIPSMIEIGKEFTEGPRHTIYNQQDLAVAARIRESTPANAIFAAAPDHNSPITLTGRKLYAGYEGTLSSHGLDYRKRFAELKDLSAVTNCVGSELCPKYLLWTERERRFWNRTEPPANAQARVVDGVREINR